MKPRPVHLNTWEAFYFDHDLERLKELAHRGAELGVERFVLDDGWFKGRAHERAGLGDWVPDPRKYPQGLGPLVDYVRSLGMQFGLWVEPEMVNADSDLYRAHPDWALQLMDRPLVTGRHQLVLDLSNEEVFAYLFAAIDKLLSDHPIAYLKWDMNRDLAAAGGRREYGAPLYHRQTLALYALIDRLRKAHPAVEIESCASGAGRADYGILKRTHRIWTSDNNDALERQTIQQGFSRFFPPEIMGAHIGPSPAHISHRRHTLAFRAATALFGHLGLELDISTLSTEDQVELKDWIGLYKRFRTLLHNGRTYQLSVRPLTSRRGHGVVALARNEALFAVVQLRASRLRIPPPVYLPGLEPGAVYRLAVPGPLPPEVTFDTPGLQALKDGKLIVPGVVLADVGLQTPILPPETALLLHLQQI
jgi:alpha-galactosidase